MEVRTESGNLEFTEPPFPMLDRLLQNAKPIKDGSGVYKVIPVGSTGNDRPKVSTNIYDAAKQINAERIENAKRQYQSIIPGKKNVQFRTATKPIREFEHVHTHPSIGNPESCDVATSLDVNPCDVDRTANKGIIAEPVGIAQSEEEDEYDSFIDPEDITI
ncbi:unnamed protein product [Sphagnum jensenii]